MSPTHGSPGVKRREFLKVLGAGGAAASAVGCGQERIEQLIPYLVSPDQTVPGVSTYYSTLCRECSAGCGVVAEVRDGRAIKLEGNPSNIFVLLKEGAKAAAPYAGLACKNRRRGYLINFGLFFNAVISFLIVAFAIFLLIRGMNAMRRQQEAPPAEPTTRECPFCFSSIAIKASRCPQCTSEIKAA